MSDNLDALTYKALQALAKEAGIKANGKKLDLITSLRELNAQNSSAPGVTASENDAAEANTLHDELPCKSPAGTPKTGKKHRRPSLERGVDRAEGLIVLENGAQERPLAAQTPVQKSAKKSAQKSAQSFLPKSCPNTPAPESDSEDAIASTLESLIESHEAELELLPCGKVRCKLTGHEMKDDVGEVGAYLGGKARARAVTKMKMEGLISEFAPHVERAEGGLMGNHNSLYVPLTEEYVTAERGAVMRHLEGKAFREALQASNTSKQWAGTRTLFKSPMGKATPSGKLRWEKQCSSISWSPVPVPAE